MHGHIRSLDDVSHRVASLRRQLSDFSSQLRQFDDAFKICDPDPSLHEFNTAREHCEKECKEEQDARLQDFMPWLPKISGPHMGWSVVRRLCCVPPYPDGGVIAKPRTPGFIRFLSGRLQVGNTRWSRRFEIDGLYWQSTDLAYDVTSWREQRPESQPCALTLLFFGSFVSFSLLSLVQCLPYRFWMAPLYVSGAFLQRGHSVLKDLWDGSIVESPSEGDGRICRNATALLEVLLSWFQSAQMTAVFITLSWSSSPGRVTLVGIGADGTAELDRWLDFTSRHLSKCKSSKRRLETPSVMAMRSLLCLAEASFAGRCPELWLVGCIKGDPDAADVQVLERVASSKGVSTKPNQKSSPLLTSHPRGSDEAKYACASPGSPTSASSSEILPIWGSQSDELSPGQSYTFGLPQNRASMEDTCHDGVAQSVWPLADGQRFRQTLSPKEITVSLAGLTIAEQSAATCEAHGNAAHSATPASDEGTTAAEAIADQETPGAQEYGTPASISPAANLEVLASHRVFVSGEPCHDDRTNLQCFEKWLCELDESPTQYFVHQGFPSGNVFGGVQETCAPVPPLDRVDQTHALGTADESALEMQEANAWDVSCSEILPDPAPDSDEFCIHVPLNPPPSPRSVMSSTPNRASAQDVEANRRELTAFMEAVQDDSLEKEWTVLLQKTSEDSRLGVTVDTSACVGHLVVDGIAEGMMNTWNQANPDKAVREGDMIMSVNGTSGDKDVMVKVCQTSESLEMKFQGKRFSNVEAASDASAEQSCEIQTDVRRSSTHSAELTCIMERLEMSLRDGYRDERTAMQPNRILNDSTPENKKDQPSLSLREEQAVLQPTRILKDSTPENKKDQPSLSLREEQAVLQPNRILKDSTPENKKDQPSFSLRDEQAALQPNRTRNDSTSENRKVPPLLGMRDEQTDLQPNTVLNDCTSENKKVTPSLSLRDETTALLPNTNLNDSTSESKKVLPSLSLQSCTSPQLVEAWNVGKDATKETQAGVKNSLQMKQRQQDAARWRKVLAREAAKYTEAEYHGHDAHNAEHGED